MIYQGWQIKTGRFKPGGLNPVKNPGLKGFYF